MIAGAVTVFALVSFGVNTVRQTGTPAPNTILVDGRPYGLHQGKVLLFFFDPECLHCFEADHKLSRLHWGGTKIVGVPITHPQYAPQFKADTGLAMPITTDHEKLKHSWLWEMVGAKVKKDVDQGNLFGLEEDLPPKRKQQLVVNPEMLIEIPALLGIVFTLIGSIHDRVPAQST